MKKLRLLALAAITTAAIYSCTSTSETSEEATEDAVATLAEGTTNVDLASSKVNWKGVMLGIKEHFGTVSLTEGTIVTTDGAITGGKFVVDLTTIAPEDTVYDENSTKEKLVGHLSSPDFFNVEEHSTATFEITGSEGTDVMGNLTVRGITHPETVKNVSIAELDGALVITGDLTFDRKKYDVSFDLPMKDMVISDDIQLNLSIVAMK